MGHIDLILSNALDVESREENLEGLQVAMDSGKLLLSIIQDILDLSKIEAGQLDIDRCSFSVRDMMQNTMKLANGFRMQRKKDQIKLSASVDDTIDDLIVGDEFRVQQGETMSIFVTLNVFSVSPSVCFSPDSLEQSNLKCYQGTQIYVVSIRSNATKKLVF